MNDNPNELQSCNANEKPRINLHPLLPFDAYAMSGIFIPAGWSFYAIHRNSSLAGFFCVQANEIHCWRHPDFQGRWLCRGDMLALLEPLFKQYGFVVTRVRKVNQIGQRFVTRWGGRLVGQDDVCFHYVMTPKEFNYGTKQP